MCRENKDTYIKVRTTKTLKDKFLEKFRFANLRKIKEQRIT